MDVSFKDFSNSYIPFSIHLLIASALLLGIYFISKRSKYVYLVDFSCYLPPNSLRAPTAHCIEHFEVCSMHSREAIDFQTRACLRSGIGPESCVPLSVHELPPNRSLKGCQEEAETVLFATIKDLLNKHKINPRNIDIIVSNCSLFCPTPSITTMIINKFGFRSNVKSFSLGGMGCSAGLLSISLARDILKVHHNSLALVLSMEAISRNGYIGTVKSMLLSNTLFRMGGAAILLSNKRTDSKTSKYKLTHLVRTHMGSDDHAYQSVFQENDETGSEGVSLSRSLLSVARNALKTNISELGPYVLPYSEQFKFAWSVFCRKFLKISGRKELYMPNFKKAINHFCIHAGGRAVVDTVVGNLKLNKEDGEASRMTLYRFGNTSSSSIWYELSYLEAKGRVKRGDKIWQIAFGSGFKCNSAVWECTRVTDPKEKNAWSDRIHLYPADIPNVADH